MNTTIPPTTKAFITLTPADKPDTVAVTDEGKAIAESDIAYGPEHGVNAWDATLETLGYRRTTAWRGDDAGLWANVEAVEQ